MIVSPQARTACHWSAESRPLNEDAQDRFRRDHPGDLGGQHSRGGGAGRIGQDLLDGGDLAGPSNDVLRTGGGRAIGVDWLVHAHRQQHARQSGAQGGQ